MCTISVSNLIEELQSMLDSFTYMSEEIKTLCQKVDTQQTSEVTA